jgi:hypothetical protein
MSNGASTREDTTRCAGKVLTFATHEQGKGARSINLVYFKSLKGRVLLIGRVRAYCEHSHSI